MNAQSTRAVYSLHAWGEVWALQVDKADSSKFCGTGKNRSYAFRGGGEESELCFRSGEPWVHGPASATRPTSAARTCQQGGGDAGTQVELGPGLGLGPGRGYSEQHCGFQTVVLCTYGHMGSPY